MQVAYLKWLYSEVQCRELRAVIAMMRIKLGTYIKGLAWVPYAHVRRVTQLLKVGPSHDPSNHNLVGQSLWDVICFDHSSFLAFGACDVSILCFPM